MNVDLHLTKLVDGVEEMAHVVAYIAAIFHALQH